MPRQPSATILGVERALDILDEFAAAQGGPLGVTQIAERIDVSKAIVHRVLSSLKARGIVRVDDDQRYWLSDGTLPPALAYLSRLDLVERGRALLPGLADTTAETATLSVLAGGRRTVIAQRPSTQPILLQFPLGAQYPLHAGASSKVLLAGQDEPTRQRALKGRLTAHTDATVTDPVVLSAQLVEIGRSGFATSLGELVPGAAAAAAPLVDRDGVTQAVITVCGPAHRLASELLEVAALVAGRVRTVSSRPEDGSSTPQ